MTNDTQVTPEEAEAREAPDEMAAALAAFHASNYARALFIDTTSDAQPVGMARSWFMRGWVERAAIRKDAEERIKALEARARHLDECVLLMDETVVIYQTAESDEVRAAAAETLQRARSAVSTARFLLRALLAEDAAPVAPRTPTTCYHYIERTPRYRDGDMDSVCGQPLPCPDHPVCAMCHGSRLTSTGESCPDCPDVPFQTPDPEARDEDAK